VAPPGARSALGQVEILALLKTAPTALDLRAV
jgi:hypothetical protein